MIQIKLIATSLLLSQTLFSTQAQTHKEIKPFKLPVARTQEEIKLGRNLAANKLLEKKAESFPLNIRYPG